VKNARERMDILAACREVGSYRGAAAICGTTHKTVKRVVQRHDAGGAAPRRKDRGHNYDEVRALVAERVRRSQGRISAKRLLSAARAAGYGGPARNFRRLVAQVRAAWRAGRPGMAEQMLKDAGLEFADRGTAQVVNELPDLDLTVRALAAVGPS
jgi:hypothetical protein